MPSPGRIPRRTWACCGLAHSLLRLTARGPGALPCFKVAKERWLTTSGVTIMKKNRNELSHLNERVSNATC